jgi:hypothetical protein
MFPVFSELRQKSNSNLTSAFKTATSLVAVLYISLPCLAIYMFGSHTKSSVLENVADECKLGLSDGQMDCPWESVVLRIMFLVVIACHVPFIFFGGKESLLVIIDELDRMTISKALETKLAFLRSNRFDDDIDPIVESLILSEREKR